MILGFRNYWDAFHKAFWIKRVVEEYFTIYQGYGFVKNVLMEIRVIAKLEDFSSKFHEKDSVKPNHSVDLVFKSGSGARKPNVVLSIFTLG